MDRTDSIIEEAEDLLPTSNTNNITENQRSTSIFQILRRGQMPVMPAQADKLPKALNSTKTNTGERPSCDICGKVLKSEHGVMTHKKMVHNGDDISHEKHKKRKKHKKIKKEKQQNCLFCGDTFYNKGATHKCREDLLTNQKFEYQNNVSVNYTPNGLHQQHQVYHTPPVSNPSWHPDLKRKENDIPSISTEKSISTTQDEFKLGPASEKDLKIITLLSELQSLLKQEVTGQSTDLICRSIRIGSYKTFAKEKVYFTQKAIYIRVPYMSASKRMITLVIPATDILRIEMYPGRSMPLLFISATPSTCERVRIDLKLHKFRSRGLYYDLTCNDDTMKKITMLPEKMSDETIQLLKVFYGKETITELDNKTANELLVKSTPKAQALQAQEHIKDEMTGETCCEWIVWCELCGCNFLTYDDYQTHLKSCKFTSDQCVKTPNGPLIRKRINTQDNFKTEVQGVQEENVDLVKKIKIEPEETSDCTPEIKTSLDEDNSEPEILYVNGNMNVNFDKNDFEFLFEDKKDIDSKSDEDKKILNQDHPKEVFKFIDVQLGKESFGVFACFRPRTDKPDVLELNFTSFDLKVCDKFVISGLKNPETDDMNLSIKYVIGKKHFVTNVETFLWNTITNEGKLVNKKFCYFEENLPSTIFAEINSESLTEEFGSKEHGFYFRIQFTIKKK